MAIILLARCGIKQIKAPDPNPNRKMCIRHISDKKNFYTVYFWPYFVYKWIYHIYIHL